MNLSSLSQVRNILGDLGVHPSKVLGQSFLIDKNILEILIKTADISDSDDVFEVGPGLGVVTEQILTRARRVVAVEKDRRLYDFLNSRLGDRQNFELICGDVLDLDIESIFRPGINKFISNLPYSSGSRILVEVLMMAIQPEKIVITVQKEVAERLRAQAGTPDYGLLSVWAQLNYGVELVKTVSAGCFWPKPGVMSAIVSITKKRDMIANEKEREMFFGLTKHAFSYRRKQLAAILSRAPSGMRTGLKECGKILAEMGFDLSVRPGNLSAEQWHKMARGILRAGAGGNNV